MKSEQVNFESVDFNPFEHLIIRVPSTEAQREIFTSVSLGNNEASCAYNESVTLTFQKGIDIQKLSESFQYLSANHDSLRITFTSNGEELLIHPYLLIPVKIVSNIDPSVFAIEETRTPFDLINGPLFRAVIIENNNSVSLIVTGHHIICDGWSLSLLLKDLGAIYTSLANGTLPVKENRTSFAEYATREEQYKNSFTRNATEEFWIDQYKEIPAIDVPIDKNRPPVRTFNAERIDVAVPSATVQALREYSKKSGCSFVTVMLSSFEIFLYKITGQKTVVTGLPAAGQNAEGMYDLTGHCVNLLPLRADIDPELTFSEFASLRKSYLFDAFDNQQFTFGTLLQKLNIHRDPSRIPLVPVVFNVDIGFTDGFNFNGLPFSFNTNPRAYENFEIFLNASGKGDELILECTYNTDLFSKEVMHDRMLQLIRIMETAASTPSLKLKNFSIVTDKDLAVIENINSTASEITGPSFIHSLIDLTAEKFPDQEALHCLGESLTYSEIKILSDKVASALIHKGVKAGDHISVCLNRSVTLPVILLGIMKAGGVYVPLDPSFPASRISFMHEDSESVFLITTEELTERISEKPVEFITDSELLSYEHPSKDFPELHPDQLAYILYTSGSTGQPKGVQIRHKSVVNLLQDLIKRSGMNSNDTFLAVTTISFDISVLELFMPLIAGASLHIATREQATDVQWLDRIIRETPINYMQATPATWEMMLSSGWFGDDELNVFCGGEALRADLGRKLTRCTKSVWNLYGPTETTIWSSLSISDHYDCNIRNGIVSIGKPVANTQIYITDENNNLCPPGIAGELWIAGEGLSTGYWKRPELTEEKFHDNPFGKNKIYKTGDRAMFDAEGNLHFLARLDHQVKIRGYRIETGEIETLLNDMESIRQSAVIARTGHNNDTYLAAYCIANGNYPDNKQQEIIIRDARETLRRSVPDYMIPTVWMILESFPLTPNGKTDRKSLPDPQPLRLTKNLFQGPVTRVEKLIAEVWKKILNLQDIDVYADFFELGGHSLLAVRMMVELEKLTGIKLPLAVLFTNPTISQLSVLYDQPDENEGTLWKPLVVIKESGNRYPLYFAHGISGNVFKYHSLANLLDADQPSYGLQAIGLNGKEEPFRDMESMAAYHVNELMQYQPDGPIALAGGSFGGYLAYEMARQLKEAGREISFLALLDIEAAAKLDFLPAGVKQLKGAQLLAERFIKRAYEFIRSDQHERQKYLEAKFKKTEGNDELESWLDKHKVAEMIGEESTFYFRKVEEACYEALMNYKIKPYNGDVLLIRAKEGFFNNTYDNDLGWSHFVNGKVNVHIVNGDHNSIFWEPGVIELAQVMNEELIRHALREKLAS